MTARYLVCENVKNGNEREWVLEGKRETLRTRLQVNDSVDKPANKFILAEIVLWKILIHQFTGWSTMVFSLLAKRLREAGAFEMMHNLLRNGDNYIDAFNERLMVMFL